MKLSDFDTLELAQAYSETTNDLMPTTAKVMTYLATRGLLKVIRGISDDDSHPLSNAADAAIITIETKTHFHFYDTDVANLLTAFQSGDIITENQKNALLNLNEVLVYPFADATAEEFFKAKSTPTEIACTYQGNDKLVVVNKDGIIVDITVPTAIDYDDYITCTAESKTNDDDSVYVYDPRNRVELVNNQKFKIEAGYSGVIAMSVSRRDLSQHVLLKLKSQFTRPDITADARAIA